MVTRRLAGTAASAPAAATAMPRVASVTGSRAVAVTTTSSGVPASRIESVTTLDIGASHGWVEAKDTRIVRHVLNPHNNPTGRMSSSVSRPARPLNRSARPAAPAPRRVRTVAVVRAGILSQHRPQLPASENEHSVQHLTPNRAHPPLRVGGVPPQELG